MAERRYSVGVDAALVALSQGTCYFPRCSVPVVVIVEQRPILNVQRAHIVSAARGGPRDVTDMDEERRNSFQNLILLCSPHHLLVDKLDVKSFPASTLLAWKTERESLGLRALNSLGSLSEERLSGEIVGALDRRFDALHNAVERLERSDRDTAALLRSVIDGMNKYQLAGGYLDMDAVSMLDRASRLLSTSANQDVAGLLVRAAEMLQHLPDTVSRLQQVVSRLPPQ